MTSSLYFPGCSHPGLVVAPSPGFDFTGLVVSGSSELGAAQSVLSVLSLRHILAFVQCELESRPPLFPRSLRRALAYGLTVWPLPPSRWDRVHGRASAGLSVESQLCECPFVVLQRQLVGSGVCSPASPICPTSSVLRRSSFGISASVFASSLRDGVTLPCQPVSVLDRNEVSSSTFLVFGWNLRDGVTLSGRVCLRSRSERRLFAHLP